MDYAEELRDILRPLRLYNVDTGLGGAELTAIGGQLNRVWRSLMAAETESCPVTAEDEGLSRWEALLPFVPAWQTGEDRRRAIAALLRIDGTSFTPDAINDTVAGCGIRAVVDEAENADMTVYVSFPYDRGEPDDIDELRLRIAQIIPCHLNVQYQLVIVLWSELEAMFAVWSEAEAGSDCWRHMERLGGESA